MWFTGARKPLCWYRNNEQEVQQINTMDERISYTIQLLGQVSERELNALSPLQMHIEQAGPRVTLVSVCTDQSGIIGLIRYLHNLGLLFLSVRRSGAGQPDNHPDPLSEENNGSD
jgi:hypothetical protein